MKAADQIQRSVGLGVAREIAPYRGTPGESMALFAAAAAAVSAMEVALGPVRTYEIVQNVADDLAMQIIRKAGGP